MAPGRTKKLGAASLTRRRAASSPLFSRAVVCALCRISEEQLGLWEQEELISPSLYLETDGKRTAVYDVAAIRRIRLIRTLSEELEVNLPGIGIILNLLERIQR